jgi:hypothetical protein
MQREVNYTEGTMVLQSIRKALDEGVTPVKTPFITTANNLIGMISDVDKELKDNFDSFVVKDDEGNPVQKDSAKIPDQVEDYCFTDEETFKANAAKILEAKRPIEFETVSPKRDVITNSGRKYPLDEFVEYSITIPSYVLLLTKEYFIEN